MIQPIEVHRACIEEADNEFVLIDARKQPNGWYPGHLLGPAYGLIQYSWRFSGARDATGPFRDRTECFDYAVKSLNERIDESLKLPDIPEKIADMLRARQMTCIPSKQSGPLCLNY